MKITALETVRVAEHPNITFVLVHTDEGLTGLGDTFRSRYARPISRARLATSAGMSSLSPRAWDTPRSHSP